MPRKTNVEFVTEIMEHAASGPLMQAFVIEALAKYARACVEASAESLDTPMLNGFAWKRCAIELDAKLAQHLDPTPKDADYIEPIREVTRERFDEMLDILPPQKWIGCGSGSQSFHISERITDNVVCWLVRRGSRYFELQDRIDMTHAQLQARAADYIERHPEPIAEA
jgi:hypothetical protein